jgi:hypothetical protein
MIKPSQFTQQMIDFQKTSFLSFYKAATAVQKQANSALDLVLNQVPWIPSEGRQAISDWLGTCRQEGDRFKTYVEKSFSNLGIYFSPEAVTKTKKSAKPSAAKAKKAAAVPAKKAAPAETQKAASVETKPAKVIPVRKTSAVEPKKVVAGPATKATPAAVKKAAPVEPGPAKPIPQKKTDAPTKES